MHRALTKVKDKLFNEIWQKAMDLCSYMGLTGKGTMNVPLFFMKKISISSEKLRLN